MASAAGKSGTQPEHCKGCKFWHNAGHAKPGASFQKFNSWCCLKGAEAHKSVGWCVTHNKKVVVTATPSEVK